MRFNSKNRCLPLKKLPEIVRNHQSFCNKKYSKYHDKQQRATFQLNFIMEKYLNLLNFVCLKLVPFPNEILKNGSLRRGVAVNDTEGKNKKLCQSIRSMYAPQITQALNNNW